ncbi:hypothetical protein HYH02_002113 [Chlamydomonas schloesseri]|uniref:peptidylprolyl isomerase n=1 Tax=Chlamydomonas schloesseri TaxID=2026947 RepID=A0A835WUE8_9CHLO|nr:hypothetical protein HYH02_002113 [Chlamydomonas schloesseri]|eukprot:KAG2453910.1 hypothetical protein HYH02_002113 [Chlamydomonas schloesseri]
MALRMQHSVSGLTRAGSQRSSTRRLTLRVVASGALKTSKCGLKWKDVEEGTGAPPRMGTTIRCHYNGRLTNGTVFDSSYERGSPLDFPIGVGQVIKGWDIGILGNEDIPPMKEGGKRLLVIPPELGYGARGAGGVIPPNATLEFDVELLPAGGGGGLFGALAEGWKKATGFLNAV